MGLGVGLVTGTNMGWDIRIDQMREPSAIAAFLDAHAAERRSKLIFNFYQSQSSLGSLE